MLTTRVLRSLPPLTVAGCLAAAGDRIYAVGEDGRGLAAFPAQGDGPATLLEGREPLAALVALPGGGLLGLGAGGDGTFWPAPELPVPPRAVRGAPDALAACVAREDLVLALRDGSLVRAPVAAVLDAVRSADPLPAFAPIGARGPIGTAAPGDLAALPDGRLLATTDDASIALLRADGAPVRAQLLQERWALTGLLASLRRDGTVDLLLTADTGGAVVLLGSAMR